MSIKHGYTSVSTDLLEHAVSQCFFKELTMPLCEAILT